MALVVRIIAAAGTPTSDKVDPERVTHDANSSGDPGQIRGLGDLPIRAAGEGRAMAGLVVESNRLNTSQISSSTCGE